MKKRIVMTVVILQLAACDTTEETEEQTSEVGETEGEGEEIESGEEEIENPSEEEEVRNELPEPVLYTEEVWSHNANEAVEIEVEVGPILVEGEHAVLPIIFGTTSETDSSLNDEIFSYNFIYEDLTTARDIRLIDSQTETASHMAVFTFEREGDQGTSFNSLETLFGEGSLNQRMTMGSEHDPAYYYSVFGAPQSEETHVFIQTLGIVENVPVVNREEFDLLTVEEAETARENEEEIEDRHAYGYPTVIEILENETTDYAFEQIQDNYLDHVYVRTVSLETYRESVDTMISRVDEVEYSTLFLSSDVLFDFDSAELTEEADAELEVAIQELEGVGGGELEIVGHTDNEHTEEYNQTLSEERAESVYDRLRELTDLNQFDEVTTLGESFREPIADNESEVGRAQNRRVELHFTPPTEQVVIESEGELPEALGVEVEYPETADVEEGRVEIMSVKQVDDLFVGRIKVLANDGNLSRQAIQVYGAGATSLTGARGRHYQESVGFSPTTLYSLTLLHGNQRYYPVDYYMETIPGTLGEEAVEEAESGESVEAAEYIVPLAERFLPHDFRINTDEEEAYYLATVVWPAVDTDEVAIELALPQIETSVGGIEQEIETVDPWRILNVPVER